MKLPWPTSNLQSNFIEIGNKTAVVALIEGVDYFSVYFKIVLTIFHYGSLSFAMRKST
jgi:hypothetical protein